ncbi:YDG domain-containing protein [Alishewanella sp. d11]|uniref:YDG domain-containing protein n=1 Tax=Alishewanella sp. d11 TaxID=3414030 RepID=UPI003BF9105F
MNHIYRLIWDPVQQQVVVASEKAKARGKKGRVVGAVMAAGLMSQGAWASSVAAFDPVQAGMTGVAPQRVAMAVSSALPATTLPQNGTVTVGEITINSAGNVMNIEQATQRGAINWHSFSVGSDATVNFLQPNSSAITLNRVVGHESSVIDGAINANGQVWILNSHGVLFNRDAQVNVGSLIATTLEMNDADFAAGSTTFAAGSGRGSIINLGTLQAADAGYIALLGQQVANEGIIHARLGTAMLAAADKLTLNFNGDSLVGVTIERGTLQALVENKQAIIADGGLVTLTAKGLDEVMRTVVNNSGEIRAQTIQNKEGRIFLLGGMENDRIEVAGKLDASAPDGGNGGFIETSAANVQIKEGLTVTTKAESGETGEWLIDPTDIYIVSGANDANQLIGGTNPNSGDPDSSNIHNETINTALASTNVTITTASNGSGAGDIYVNADITWVSENTLTLSADRNIYINAIIDLSNPQGLGGGISLYYGQGDVAENNTASYNFGLTNSGFSGKINLPSNGLFTTKLGSDGSVTYYSVITSLGLAEDFSGFPAEPTLQWMANQVALDMNFVLGADIDASDTANWNSGEGWTPIGNDTNKFTGKFDGLGHTISGLTVNRGEADYQGFFGFTDGAIVQNIGTKDGSITGLGAVGGIVGWSENSNINNIYNTGTVTGLGASIGGVIGRLHSGIIVNGYSTGLVTGNGDVGGFAGYVEGELHSVFASGNVNGGGTDRVGGLVGYLVGSDNTTGISNAYSTGNVSGHDYVGGFVGQIYGRKVSNSYSVGVVSGSANGTVGGFAGTISSGNLASPAVIENSFWNSETAGQPSGVIETSVGSTISLNAGTTAGMKLKASYITSPPWDLTGEDGVYPTLTFGSGVNGAFIWQMSSSITQLLFTLSPLTGTYVYKGSAFELSDLWSAESIFGSQYSSWIAGQDYQFIYNNETVTGFTNAGIFSNISIDILKDGYIVASSGNTNGSLTIDPKALTLSASKIYDGNVNLTGAHITFGGLVGSETLTYTGATANSKNVADNATNYITAITLVDGTGVNAGLASNYQLPTLNLANAPVAISPKGVMVNAAVGDTKVYDGTTVATISGAMIVGMMPGDHITVNTGTFADANAGTKAVTPILSGDDAGNYFISFMPPVIGTITPRTLTLNGADNWLFAFDKDYDGLTSTDATILFGTGMASLGGLVGNETVNVTAAGEFADKNAGDNKDVTVSFILADGTNGGLASNYDLADIIKQATIYKKYITVTGDFTANNKTYDGTRDATFATNSLILDGLAEGEAITLSGLGLEFADANAGTGKTVNLIGGEIASTETGDADNYVFTLGEVPATTTADILKKTLTLNGADNWLFAFDKDYDGLTSTDATILFGTGMASLGGLVGNETVNVTAAGEFADKNAGDNKDVTVSFILADGTNGGLASNYDLADIIKQATIYKKYITVTGDFTANNKTYDGTRDATFATNSLILDGLAEGEAITLSGLGLEFADANAGTGKTVNLIGGEIASTETGDADNYVFTLGEVPATTTAEIFKKALTISGSSADDKHYDGNTTAAVNTGGLSGMLEGDTVAVTATGAFDNANAGTGKSVTVTYSLDNPNYTLADETLLADILAKALSISGSVVSNKTYDGTTTASVTAGAVSGMLEGDTVAVTATGAFDNANAGTGKSVTVTYTLDNPNYTLADETLLADILAKALSISGSVVSNKTYDGTTTASVTAGAVSGMLEGDTVAVTATGAFGNANAGTGKSVTVTYSLDNPNYTLADETLLADILAKALSISGSVVSNKTYDGTTTASVTAGAVSGMLEGDTVAVTATGAFDNANAGTGKSVTVTYTLDNPSYTLADEVLLADILRRSLSIVGTQVQDKVFDGSTLAQVILGQLQGLVGDETLVVSATGTFDSAAPGSRTATVDYNLADGTNGGLAANYELAAQMGLTATINPATLPTPVVNLLATTIGRESLQLQGATSIVNRGAEAQLFSGERLTAVITLPVALAEAFGEGNAQMVSMTNGDEATLVLSLNEAESLLFGESGGAEDEEEREIRVPVSRNSLAQIVNGGVRLPEGVQQKIFLVKGNPQ